MRTGCYDCVRKHLGEAAIFDTETGLGYPDFDIYVIGSLSHAAQEAEALNPALALCLRDWRLLYMHKEIGTVQIPYEALSAYIKVCMQAKASGLPCPNLEPAMYPQP